MSLFNYVSACSGFLNELRESITKAEIAALHQDLSGMSMGAWYDWVSNNAVEISSFVEAAPSARNAKKKWKDPSFRGRLVLAAHQHVNQAQILLQVVAESPLEPGGSYRLMASIAGDAYNKVLLGEFQEWPFDGESPFS